ARLRGLYNRHRGPLPRESVRPPANGWRARCGRRGAPRAPALAASATQQVLVQQVLVALLLAAGLLRLADLRRQRGQVGQAQLAFLEGLAIAGVEAGVTLLAPLLPRRIVEQRVGHFQALGESVHAADVGDEQVLHVGGLAARLGVEVQATDQAAL